MKISIQCLIVGILFFSNLGVSAFASDTPSEKLGYVLPNTQIIPLTSQINGVNYELYIKLPKNYGESDKRYPVMVTLDADYQFAVAASHLEHLWDRGQAPEMIIVSISYDYEPGDGLAYRINRTRDYTPAFVAEGGYGPSIQKYSGGGPAFAKFIGEEMLPYLEAHYRTAPGERVFVGHSFGGLFGAYLLRDHPALFNRYILVSPSLWYNGSMMLTADAGEAVPLSQKTYVYMGVGSLENTQGARMMADDLLAYEEQLSARNDPNLIVKARVFDDETHASIFPVVLSTGIRYLFQTMDE